MSKRIFTVSIIVSILLIIIIAYLAIYVRNDVNIVSKQPLGYILLDEVITNKGIVSDYVFWENQISLLDFSGNTLYQTDVKNKDFIVKYNGKYYINEVKYIEILDNIREG